MLPVFSPFSSFVTDHALLSYGLLFLGVFWEGELALIGAGILVHLGVFDGWIVLPVAILAATLKTIVGYRLGAYLGRVMPESRILAYLERRILHFLPRFREKPFWSIVLSKFIYGINNVTLLFAGYMRADFRKYCLAELVSSLVWFGAMYSLGYFASGTALAISNNLKTFSLLLLLFVLAIMIMVKIVAVIIEIAEELGTQPKKPV